jgi:multidrug efflux pump subunit AcrB
MIEKELIGKIEILRQIRPRKNWVFLTKKQILGEERTLSGLFSDSLRVFQGLFYQYKFALASLMLVLILGGTFAFAQKSLPGEALFLVKKITEKTRAVFVSEKEKPGAQLELTNKRLEELTQIAQKNEVKKLAPAIEEFQASVSESAKKLVQIREPEKTREMGKKVIAEIKKLEENKEKVESLGVVIGDSKEIEDAMCQLTTEQIKDLGTLTEKQQELLEEAKKYLEEGECSLAFEKILLLSYPQ